MIVFFNGCTDDFLFCRQKHTCNKAKYAQTMAGAASKIGVSLDDGVTTVCVVLPMETVNSVVSSTRSVL